MTNNTDDFLVDKFIRCVENRIVNEPNGSTYKIYEGTRGDWVAWASKQEPRVRLPYASRFCRLRLLLRGRKMPCLYPKLTLIRRRSPIATKNFFGAFYTRTKYFGQLWVIHAFFPAKTFTDGLNVCQKRMIPCAWAFRARRRTKNYLRILTALKNEAKANGLTLKPSSIMLD